MSVIEHPRLGIDIAIKPMMFHMKISKGYLFIPNIDIMGIEDDYEEFAPGFDIDAQMNIANITGIRQTFSL